MKPTNMFILLLAAIALSCDRSAFAENGYIDEFGVTEGEHIETGVVFIDGEYIASPYMVSRRGLALYVNNREIKRPRRHMETPILTGDVDLSRLTGQERQRLHRALESTRGIYEENLRKGYGYLFSSKGGHVRLLPHDVGYKLPKVMGLLASNTPRDEKLQRLQDRNWHLHVDIEPFIDKFIPSPQLANKMARQAQGLLRVEEFGTGDPCSVSDGFFFLSGRYMEPPYIFQRKGLGLFLNGELLSPPPVCLRRVPSGDNDVSTPPEINAESSWFDDVVMEYLMYKGAYLYKHYAPDQASDMMAKAIAALPLVAATAQRDERHIGGLNVTTTEGLRIPCQLSAWSRRDRGNVASPQETVQARLSHFHRMLSKGVCYLVSDGGWTCLSCAALGKTLPQVVGILDSGTPPEAKVAAIRQMGLGMPDRAVETLVHNFSQSAQLDARVTALSFKDHEPTQP